MLPCAIAAFGSSSAKHPAPSAITVTATAVKTATISNSASSSSDMPGMLKRAAETPRPTKAVPSGGVERFSLYIDGELAWQATKAS